MHRNASKNLRSAGILPALYLKTGDTPVLRIDNNGMLYPQTGETPVLRRKKTLALLDFEAPRQLSERQQS